MTKNKTIALIVGILLATVIIIVRQGIHIKMQDRELGESNRQLRQKDREIANGLRQVHDLQVQLAVKDSAVTAIHSHYKDSLKIARGESAKAIRQYERLKNTRLPADISDDELDRLADSIIGHNEN